MAFYFRPFPKINYDIKKNGIPLLLTDVTKRYKIRDILQQKTAIYYNYTIRDGDRPDLIAFKYYGDETLDSIFLKLTLNSLANSGFLAISVFNIP